MTTCYQWFSFPEKVSVICPQCRGEADCKKAPWLRQETRWGSTYYVVSELNTFDGYVSCLHCGLSKQIQVFWPQDAYWKCDVRGQTLWAWSLEHTKVLLDYIRSSARDEKAYPGYLASLLHLPTHFKLAKHREVSIKSLSKLIHNM